MDPIFDRLGRLIRSWGGGADQPPRSSDPLQREAEDELEDFLRTGRNEAPKRDRAQTPPPRPEPAPADPELARALAELGLATGATWEQVGAAHRTLLKKHHPDRHAGDEARQREATARSQVINQAYQLIKKRWGR